MKAFQLKIAIKNSKPPIWRRVIVPTGITFSQLSMILNKVMGWCGYHMFEFEFYHLELRIVEDADELDIGYGPFDYIEATDTCIESYLEENDWFTYTYDLGDDWQHRVTIEKVLNDYAFDFPQVIKYKGNCPLEDSGGIYGYYEYLNIISDKTHPEYEDTLTWMELQGYPNEYDMDDVNEQLKSQYFYKWGEMENRSQAQIYEQHFSGKYGLKATKKSAKSKKKVNQSGKHKMEDAMQRFVESFEKAYATTTSTTSAASVYDAMYGTTNDMEQLLQQKYSSITLKDIFQDYTKEDLLEIAKEKDMINISKLNKDKLILSLTRCMLEPFTMMSYFMYLSDEEIEMFENAAKTKGLYEESDPANYINLYRTNYIGMITDGRLIVPQDVFEAYQFFQGEEFTQKRKMGNYVLYCLRTVRTLYGIAPFSVLMKLINQNQSMELTEDEVRYLIARMPQEYDGCIIKEDFIYREDLYHDDRGLQRVQGDRDFYIPSMREITDYGKWGYDTTCKYARKLQQFLMKKMHVDSDEAKTISSMMQLDITNNCEMQDIFNLLEEFGIFLDSESHIQGMIDCINDLWNHTRMLVNRGFTPNEVMRIERNSLCVKSDPSNIINFEQARKNKVYPNDPCPCGSGKKYKNCCKMKK